MVLLQAMFRQAVIWRWVPTNPVKAVPKPSGKRERAVVCLAPAQVEAIRARLLEREQLYAATIVSLVAYQGLRVPEEVLALEVRHVGRNTVLVEQRLIKGSIVGGQKVRGFHPRPVKLEDPVRRDVAEYLVATGLRSGLLFPRTDSEPWKVHDYKNWTRRVWHAARRGRRGGPDAALRPAACLRIAADPRRPLDPRAGRATRALAADDRLHLHARDPRAGRRAARVSGGANRAGTRCSWTRRGRLGGKTEVAPTGWKCAICRNGEGQNRTGDTTIFSRVLYQLSYLAEEAARRW